MTPFVLTRRIGGLLALWYRMKCVSTVGDDTVATCGRARVGLHHEVPGCHGTESGWWLLLSHYASDHSFSMYTRVIR